MGGLEGIFRYIENVRKVERKKVSLVAAKLALHIALKYIATLHSPYLNSEAPKLNVACWNEVNEKAGKYPEVAWAAKRSLSNGVMGPRLWPFMKHSMTALSISK